MRYRSNNAFTCPITIRAPYGGGVHGALYHSQSVEAFFTHVPGLKVVIPSTPYDAKGLLRTAIRDDDPVLFFEHKKMYRSVRAERVAGEGIDVEVIDVRSLRPLDKDTILSSVRNTGKCLVAYEDNRFGGYGAEICATVAEEAFDYLDGPVSRIAGPDVPGVPFNHALEDWFMLSPAKIADAIRKLAAY